MSKLLLRPLGKSDLPQTYRMQADPVSIRMAAFTCKDPNDHGAIEEHWEKLILDRTVDSQAIVWEGFLAGFLTRSNSGSRSELSFWVSRSLWGQGIASAALAEFVTNSPVRPLFARVASDNGPANRVLEKAGFRVDGYAQSFANGRGAEIKQTSYVLA